MNVPEYKKKYLFEGCTIKDFADDFDRDFLVLLRTAKGLKTKTAFKNCLTCTNRKWNLIFKEIRRFNDFWKTFLERRVLLLFKELFPNAKVVWIEELILFEEEKEKAEKSYDRKQKENQWKQQNYNYEKKQKENNSYKGYEYTVYKSPLESDYKILGLKGSESIEIVKQKYRQLALIHHPDKGGSHDLFIKITNAKNRILKVKSK